MKHVAVIGYGSIGRRHAEFFSRLGCMVSVVSQQNIDGYVSYKTIEQLLEGSSPDSIVIANPTYLHFETLKRIVTLDFQKTILVEKPLFSKMELLSKNSVENIYVAYHLRCHALLLFLKEYLKHEEIVSFSAYVGSYLPNWRKNSDYRTCYSSKKDGGGGVLRDLSHELDYVLWMCGKCIEVTAIGGHFSTLEIDSDDIYAILMRCAHCPVVNIHLNYLNREPVRQITIHTKKQDTIFLDLIHGDFLLNGKVEMKANDAMSEAFNKQDELFVQENFSNFCSYQDGLSVIELFEAIEKAALEKKWIKL